MEESKIKFLNLPQYDGVEFERNPIKTAVCELRFPTLLQYEGKPRARLQHELRKEYPFDETHDAINVGPDLSRETKFLFKSKKRNWTISFSQSAIALETSKYTNFEEFWRRLVRLVEVSQPILDTDFFTRVGLRYVNMIALEDSTASGWIRKDLVGPLIDGIYGAVGRYTQEVRGLTEAGNYTFRHGFVEIETPANKPVYALDFDFYKENVEYGEVEHLVSGFNKLAFRFFCWALDDKARSYLGKATVKHLATEG